MLLVLAFVSILHGQGSERRRRRGRVKIETSGRARTEDDIRNTRRRLANIVDPRRSKAKAIAVFDIIDEERRYPQSYLIIYSCIT